MARSEREQEEFDLMRRQVEAHERIADVLERLGKALAVDLSDGTVVVRVAQV